MSKKPEFADLFFSKTKDFLDIFLKSQEQRSRDTIKAYRISLSSFYKYVTEVKEMIVMQFCFSDCTYMKATLCEQTLDNACRAYPMLRGAILHSDRGTQYTSELYRKAINKYGILQSMNSASGRCHDNARCESMWARFKEELLYGRYDTTTMTVEQLKTLIWRYFISYWNNRRICSSNGGLPPMVKRQQYYTSLQEAA